MTETDHIVELWREHLVCVQCGKHNDPVTPENGRLVEDAEKKLVPLHHVCVPEWERRKLRDNSSKS